MTRAVEIRISGEVQGVSFRAYAAHEAIRAELRGWIRNDPDGAVSARLEGDPDDVEQMLLWCRAGSPGARVDDVAVDEVTPEGADTFTTYY